MKQFLGFAAIITFMALSMLLEPLTGHETRLTNLSRLTTVILMVGIILLLIKRYKVNVKEEFKTLFKFKTETLEFKISMRILVGGTVLPIIFMIFFLAPIFSFTLKKINSIDPYICTFQKVKIVETYYTGGSKKNHFADIVYDGKPITLRLTENEILRINTTRVVRNLYRGYLGFYFVK